MSGHFSPSLNALMVDELELDALPTGAVSRLLLTVTHDALGRAVRLPVMVGRGSKPGPVLGITAAVHGDELNGIPVIHQLFQRLEPAVVRGSIVAVMVANVPGFLNRQRRFLDQRDLNHLMPGDKSGNISQVYVHRFLNRVVRHFDFLVDLHTASVGRVNSLYVRADMTDPLTARMAHRARPQIILHNPPSDSTLRGTATERGVPSITVEVGDPLRFQPEFIKKAIFGLRGILEELGFLKQQRLARGPEPILCQRSYWMYTDHGGLLQVLPRICEQVKKGEPVAHLTDIFGAHLRTYEAPHAGVVIGHSTNPSGGTGARILHLGIPGEAGKPPFHPPW